MTYRRIACAAAVTAVIAAAAFLLSKRDPLRDLVDAARDRRLVEARLTGGFGWAPLRGASRAGGDSAATPDTTQIRLSKALWDVLAATENDQSAGARRAAATALLLQGKGRAAIAALVELADATRDADVLSDLAAARCEVASADDDPALLAEALAAADAALRIAPQHVEALFNRALIIDRLGLRQRAREAWLRYADAESDSAWAAEARLRANALAPLVGFRDVLDKQFERLASDAAFAQQTARAHPQDARRYGETKILGLWAEAERAGDAMAAEKNLRIARELGRALSQSSGEGMLSAAVAAIDRADRARRLHLVEAHILFRKGQGAFMKDLAAEAQQTLIAAAREFELGGSPLAIVAEYFVAHTFHALGDLGEARKRELQLIAAAPPQFPAHRAQLLWHLGLGHMSDGDWGKALAALKESVTALEAIGEMEFAGNVRGLIAEVYDRTGNPDAAWKERIAVLREIGRGNDMARLQMSLRSISHGAMTRKQWPVAVSLLDLASEIAARLDRPILEVETRVLQARAYARSGEARYAAESVANARAAAARIEDAALREEANAEVIAAAALIEPSPDRAAALLTRAIEYHQARGRRIALPEMYLGRGRALRQTGDARAAAADFERGIAEVERHREALPAGEQRWGAFEAATDLFDDAIALALARRDAHGAFAYAERARARELLDTLGATPPQFDAAKVPRGVALVEYVALSDRLVAFVVDHEGVHAFDAAIGRAALERDAARLTLALRTSSGEVRTAARTLYRHLIEPVAERIRTAETLVVVPAQPFATVPFAALVGGDGRFLIERHAIVTAPSAAVFNRLQARQEAIRERAHLLILANPTLTEEVEPLPAAEREASEAASRYPRATRFTRERATLDAFRRNAASANVIHLATHGVEPSGTRTSAALLLAGGRLDVPAITSTPLSRTAAVVLAACSTARGADRAEGTISVARAFLAAGAPAVVATLWPIDDAESAEFFPRLHGELARGVAVEQALRTAQLAAIQRRSPPSLWAAVQCIGS